MDQKNPQNFPFLLGNVDLQCLVWFHSPPKWQRNHFTHLYTTTPQSPHWLHGGIWSFVFMPHPWTQPTHHPKLHPGPITHFPFTLDCAIRDDGSIVLVIGEWVGEWTGFKWEMFVCQIPLSLPTGVDADRHKDCDVLANQSRHSKLSRLHRWSVNYHLYQYPLTLYWLSQSG